MFRSRSWFGTNWGRPKNPHSLEHLKYLYNVLSRNQTVSEHNRGLLVETLRSIAEILIWGDQNDSSVFEYVRKIFIYTNLNGTFPAFSWKRICYHSFYVL